MVKVYDSLNNLVGEGSYLDGKKHGPWIEYDKYGRSEGTYENDIRVGVWKRYRDTGLLWIYDGKGNRVFCEEEPENEIVTTSKSS